MVKANCLKCRAKCAVHALKCEADVMKDRCSIDCETFLPVTIDDTLEIEQEKQEVLTVMRGVRKLLEKPSTMGDSGHKVVR